MLVLPPGRPQRMCQAIFNSITAAGSSRSSWSSFFVCFWHPVMTVHRLFRWTVPVSLKWNVKADKFKVSSKIQRVVSIWWLEKPLQGLFRCEWTALLFLPLNHHLKMSSQKRFPTSRKCVLSPRNSDSQEQTTKAFRLVLDRSQFSHFFSTPT